MDRFLIEVPHEEDVVSCARIIKTFLQTGSHYLTNADWGCEDGDHRGFMIVEAGDREEARLIVPPPHRDRALVIRLTKFTPEEIDELLEQHGG